MGFWERSAFIYALPTGLFSDIAYRKEIRLYLQGKTKCLDVDANEPDGRLADPLFGRSYWPRCKILLNQGVR